MLQYSSLRLLTSMATESCRVLKQDDCKNAFCNACLPADKTTIIRPPPGDPDAKKDVFWLPKKTLYGLGRSSRHWYNLVNSILVEASSPACTTHDSTRASHLPPMTATPRALSTSASTLMTVSTSRRTQRSSAALSAS